MEKFVPAPSEQSSHLSNASNVRNASEVFSDREGKEYLELAIDTAIKNYLSKLSKTDRISLDAASIAQDAERIVLAIDSGLPNGHPLKWHGKILVDNFLQPKERGIRTIQTFSRLLPSARSEKPLELRPDEIGNLIESALVSAFDFARISTKEGIARFLSIVERVPELRDFFRNAPDVREMLVSLIPELIGSVDRKDFVREIGSYVKRIAPQIMSVVDDIRTKNPERQDTALLATLSETTALVSRLLNEKNSETIFSAVKRLSITKEHPVLSRLVRVLDDPGISPATRLKFARKLLDGANILTEPKLDESKLTKFGDELFALLAVIRNESKQPARISALIIEISNLLLDKQESTVPLGNYDMWEAFKLLFVDNREQMFEIWKRYREGSIKTVNDVIRFIVEGNMLQENVRMANGALFRRLKEIGDFSISQAMQNFRATYLQKLHTSNKEPAKSNEKPTDGPLVSALRESFARNGTAFLSDAVKAGREVRTDEISRLVLTSVAGAIRTNRAVFTREFSSLGIVLPTDPKELDQRLQKLASNPIVIRALSLAIRENGPKFASDPKSLSSITDALAAAFSSDRPKAGKTPSVDLRSSLVRSVTEAFYEAKDGSSRSEALTAALAFAPDQIRAIWNTFPPAQKEGICQAFARTFDRAATAELLESLVAGTLTPASALSFLTARGDLRTTLGDLHASGVLRLVFAPSAKSSMDWKSLATSYPQLVSLRGKVPDSEMRILQPYLGVSMDQFQVIDQAFRSFPAELIAKTLRDPANKSVLDAIASDGVAAVSQGKDRPAFLRMLATLLPHASPDDLVRAAKAFLPAPSDRSAPSIPKLQPEEAEHLATIVFHTLQSPSSAALLDDALPASIRSDARFARLVGIFGKSIGVQARDMLQSVGQERSVRIFLAHQDFLSNALSNDLSNESLRAWIVRIVADVVRAVDPEELGKRFDSGARMEPSVRAVVLRTPALANALRGVEGLEGYLATGIELAERFPYPPDRKVEPGEREKIRSYGEKTFDVLGRFISSLPPGDLERLVSSLSDQDQDKSSIESSSGSSGDSTGAKNPLLKQLKSSFLSKNFWFVLSNVFPVVFGGQTTERSIQKYFSDTSNRENFGKTCWHVAKNFQG